LCLFQITSISKEKHCFLQYKRDLELTRKEKLNPKWSISL